MRQLLNTPTARVLGSAVSWVLFTVSFTLLYRVSAVVMGLGGFCASGGPYVIETECPDAVVLFAPLSIFGGLIASAIAAFVARGFGTPLVIWAWPILFTGLGIAFLQAALVPGGLANLVVGIVFVAMGLAPVLFVLRVGAARLLIGTTTVHDRPFRDRRGPTPIFGTGGDGGDRDARPAMAGDWMLALGVFVPSVALGLWFAQLLFDAAAPAPR